MAGFQRQSLRGLTAQLLFVTVLPLTAIIGVISFGSIYLHNHAMRELIAERDARTAQVAARLVGNLAEQGPPPMADLARLRQRLDAAMAGVFAPDGEVSFVVFDAGAQAVYSVGNARMPGNMSGHAGVAEALRGEHGITYSADEPGGPEHVIAFAPVLINGRPGELGLIVEEPWEHAVDPLMRYSLAVPLTTFPVLLLAALAVVFGVRRIVQPLQKLGDQAIRLGAGDFEAVAERVGGIEEVNQLQAALSAMAHRIQADQEQLRGYASAVTAAQEAERARLARELHDDTLQNLIFLSQRAQTLRITSERDNPLLAAKIETLRQMALQMVENLRRFSRALRPLYLEDAGLVAALERLANETTEAAPTEGSAAIRVTFDCDGDVPRLAPDTELALFRIAQESMNNALRHGRATRIEVQLEALPEGAIALEIRDNGQGFAPAPSGGGANTPAGGFGLVSIRERAMMIGAHVQILASPGKGTRIIITLPATRKADEPRPA